MRRDVVEQCIDTIQGRAEDEIRALLEPLARRAFTSVCRRNQHVQRVLFGNGTFLICGTDDRTWHEWDAPRYMDTLFHWCRRLVDFGGPDEDFKREST